MAVKGPTQGAARHAESVNRWKSHPHLARLLRALILLVPMVVAITITYGAGRLLPPERLGIHRWIWILGAFVVCNVVLVWMGKLSRRAMPLVALMKLSLVFPDQAPARAKTTLRKSNSRKLFREIESARQRGETSGAVTYGEYMIQLLREVNEHDRLTRGHSERVRAYAEMLGEEIGLDETEMEKLRWAALLHDVGKLEVPEHILNKDGRPTKEEWAILQEHPAEGGRLLAPLRFWLGDWVHAADQHHLRWDGNGYPVDLAGTDISLAGRLVAIADAYDVMSSARSYKKPLRPELARQELTSCAGSQFDPNLVRAFLNIGLGRLRAVAGRLAWFSNLLGSTQVPAPVITSTVTAVGTTAAAAAAVAVSVFAGAVDAGDEPVQALPFVDEVEVGVQVDDLRLTLLEDEPIMIELSAEGEGAIAFGVGEAAHGRLMMDSPGSAGATGVREVGRNTVTYHPFADYHGEDSFVFEACDATGSCAVGTVMLGVEPVNDAPTANEDRATTDAGEPLALDVLDNDTDIDGDELRLIEVYPPAHGEARIVDGKIVFDPPTDFVGTVRIDYAVADAEGVRALGTVVVEIVASGVAPNPPVTTTTAPAVDDPPVTESDSVTTSEDTATWIDVLANDRDPEQGALAITGVSAPVHGTAVAISGLVYYTPDSDFYGTDRFVYTISDGTNPAVSATVTVAVAAVNDPPTATASDASLSETTAPGTAVLTVFATDVDGDRVEYALAGGDPTGRFTIDSTGELTLAAPLDHETVSSYSLGLTVSDGMVVAPVSVTVTVSDVDENPTVAGDSASTAEDTTTAIAIGSNDRDPEGAALTFAVPATSIAGATLAENGGVVTYTPPTNWNGTDRFTYTTSDPAGNRSLPATVSIVVRATNDPPVAGDDGGIRFTTVEDTLLTTADVTINDTDVDDPIDPASITVITPPANGTLVDNGDGTFDYQPDPDFNGTDAFTYTITDPGGLTSNVATVTLNVVAANDAPVAGNDSGVGFSTLEDVPFTTADVTGNDSDVEDGAVDPATINVLRLPINGTLVDNGDGTFDYDPDPDFNGNDSFTYQVYDSGLLLSNTATVTLTITADNDAPVANNDSGIGFTTVEDTVFTTTDVTANDADVDDPVDPASITVITAPTDGTLVDNGDGTFDYDPDPDFNGTDAFTYTITDPGPLTSNTATVTMTIMAENDAPVANDDSGVGFTTPQDTLITTADVTANDTDVDDPVNPASITVVTPPATGTLVDNGDGTFDFDPAPGWSGTETFTYTITDPGALSSNVATVTLDVVAANGPPVAADDGGIGFTTFEDTVFTTADVTANDSDVEDGAVDPATINVLTVPANGTLVDNGDGTFDYDPDPDFNGTDTFTYEVYDSGLLLSNTATVTLTITAENDAPVANNDSGVGFATLEDTVFTTADVTANDSDAEDGTVDPATINVLSLPVNGTLVDNGDGTFDYDPDPDFNGTDSFTYEVYDSGLLLSNTATVTLTITPTADADPSGPYTIAEGDVLVLDGSGSTDSPTTWNWDLDNDGQYDDASGVTPTLSWATLTALGIDDNGVYPIALEVDGGADTAATSLTVDNVAPLLTATGAASVSAGTPYTLDLGAFDPGNDTIAGWTINWGDGTIDTVAGNPSSVTHTYTAEGFTFDILVSASDEDGTFLQNQLLVPSFGSDSVFRFEETTGDLLQVFAAADDPIETEVGPDGRLYVTGEWSDNVVRYDAETGVVVDEFVAAGSGGLDGAEGLAFGPDGHLYVADYGGDRVLRFDGTTGAFIDVFAGSGLTGPYDLLFGPDSNLYVTSRGTHEVVRFDGTTGAFIDVFVTAASGGLNTPQQMTFGPDGNLYVSSFNTDQVLRYNGTTGTFIDVFVAAGGIGGLDRPSGLVFGPDGHLYVADRADHAILRFHGATGAFIDEYVAAGTGGLSTPGLMTFLPAKQVTIDVTGGIEDFDGVPAAIDNCPTRFNLDQYDTDDDNVGDACDPSPTLPTAGTFTDTGQTLGAGASLAVSLGDVDGDGDLDAAFANNGDPNTIWFNDGTGTFTDSGQALGTAQSLGLALADFDGDGDLDITYATAGANTVWFNDGTGVFTDSGQTLGSATSNGVAVADFDGDGDLDVTYANAGANTVWFNDGTGTFTDSGQTLSTEESRGLVLGDFDGDKDIDIAYANKTTSTVWLNDGTGSFTDSGGALGAGDSVAAGDVDGNGDLDLTFGVRGLGGNTLWLNDGTGAFTDSGQSLTGDSRAILLHDLDGDGDLDLAYGIKASPNTVWFNDGAGTFTDSGQSLDPLDSLGIAAGDLDGDGDLDIVCANDSGAANTVWLN